MSYWGIDTDHYTKITDAHLYLLASSCHPKHIINEIPKAQFISVRRIYSSYYILYSDVYIGKTQALRCGLIGGLVSKNKIKIRTTK